MAIVGGVNLPGNPGVVPNHLKLGVYNLDIITWDGWKRQEGSQDLDVLTCSLDGGHIFWRNPFLSFKNMKRSYT